jgi:DNA-binding transcriptional LysR family regulator
MDFRELRYFRAIADFGTLSKAAVHLRVAQPALSRHVMNLERELGVELLRRTPRGVTLTEAGRVLLERTLKLEHDIAATRREVSALGRQVTGALNVAVQSPLAGQLMPGVVKAYREKYPDVELRVKEGTGAEMTDALLNRRLDVAILDVPNHAHTDLKAFPLWTESLSLIGPRTAARHPVFKAGKVSIAQLAELPVIMPGRHSSIRRLVDDAFGAEHLKFQPAIEAGGVHLLGEMVKIGLGYALMPTYGFLPLLVKGELVEAEVHPRLRWTVSVVTRPALVTDRIVAPFIALIRTAVPRLAVTRRRRASPHCQSDGTPLEEAGVAGPA